MFGTFQEKNWGISFMLKAVAISVDSKKLELYENRLQDLNLQEEPFADLDNNGFLKKLWKIHRKTHDSKSPSNNVASLQLEICYKDKIRHRCFLESFPKFLRTTFIYIILM